MKKLYQHLPDVEFYKRRGHAVLACLSVLYLTVAYVAGVDVNLSIFADLTIAAGMLIILPKIKLNGVETSNKLTRNIFGYVFLSIVVFVAIGDSHNLLDLPGESKTEFFTIISHIMMMLFGASKIEISRRAIESAKDAFNWKRGLESTVSTVGEGAIEKIKDLPIPTNKVRKKQLTANFNISEFACKDGVRVPIRYYNNVFELARNLQVLRNHTGKRITLVSAYRHPKYNAGVGGAKNSQHLLAKAGDIKVEGMTPSKVHKTIESLIAQGKMRQGGLGLYGTFVHYDVRGVEARWTG